MTDKPISPISSDDVVSLARAAALELEPERLEPVATALAGVLALLESLDKVDLGELPPTGAFDPRWRDLE